MINVFRSIVQLHLRVIFFLVSTYEGEGILKNDPYRQVE